MNNNKNKTAEKNPSMSLTEGSSLFIKYLFGGKSFGRKKYVEVSFFSWLEKKWIRYSIPKNSPNVPFQVAEGVWFGLQLVFHPRGIFPPSVITTIFDGKKERKLFLLILVPIISSSLRFKFSPNTHFMINLRLNFLLLLNKRDSEPWPM